MSRNMSGRGLVGVLLSWCASGCGGASDDAATSVTLLPRAPAPVSKPAPVAASLAGVVDDDRREPAMPASETKDGGAQLLAHVPSNAWFVAHVPNVAAARAAWSKTAISKLLEQREWREIVPDLEHWLAQLRVYAPWLDDLQAMVRDLHGEMVLAMVDVDVDRFAGSALPFTLLVQLDIGEQSSAIGRLIDLAFSSVQSGKPKAAPSGHWQANRADLRLEAVLEHGLLTAIACPPDAPKDQLSRYTGLPPEKSFLATELFRSAASGAGRTAFAEVFVQLDALWRLARVNAPGEVGQLITASGLDRLSGVSAVMGAVEASITESVHLYSPGGKDLLSRILGAQPVATKLVRWIPSDARAGGVMTLDLPRAFEEVLGLLKPDDRRQVEEWRSETLVRSQIDLRKDVIENLGPNFAYASRGNLAALALGGSFSWLVAAELKDRSRATRVLAQVLERAGMTKAAKPRKIADQDATVLALPPLPFAAGGAIELKPAWCVLGDALLVASDASTLESALKAGMAADHAPPRALQQALELAGDGAWSVSFSDASEDLTNMLAPMLSMQMPEVWSRVKPMLEAADLPSTMTSGRKADDGLHFEARSATGIMLSAAGLGGTAIAASIAIPSLISARIEANERVAVQTLRRIAAAEDKLHVAKALDADRDGRAEYGRLADLVKKAAGHGLAQPSAPPLVDDQLLTPQEGFGEKSGYVFWVGFPEPDVATPAPRRAAANVNTADSAEAQFIAYAWPKSCGQTGLKIYAIDAAGQLYYSDNTSPGQSYSGYAHTPHGDAALPMQDPERALSNSVLHRGNDGALWLLKD